jgi:hypothetical protein
MKPVFYLIFIGMLFVAGCAAMESRPQVDVEIINKSSHDLENAQAVFGDFACKWGWVVKTTTAVYAFYPHPITASAELQWDEDGKHHVEKLDLRDCYKPGDAGRLTFTVLDGRTEVRFQKS